MKKFSNLNKIDINDDQPKTFLELLEGFYDETLSIKVEGQIAENLTQDVISITGKDDFLKLVEKLVKVNILKERVKLLEAVKVKTFKNRTLNWIDGDIQEAEQQLNAVVEGSSDVEFNITELINDLNEGWQSIGEITDDNRGSNKHLKSFEYFVDTFDNGNITQLRTMFKSIKRAKKIKELKSYLKEIGDTEIIDWILDNIDE
jgi:peptidoglycan hydrolase CwlO-like protein